MQKYFYLLLTLIGAMSLSTQAFALTVSPARLELRGDPGQTVNGEIEILNEQADAKIFYSSFENFESRGDTGQPFFTDSTSGLATWVTVEPKVSIASGERKTIPFSIVIPKNAKPGGYFAATFFSSEKPKVDGGGQVSLGGKVGVLMLLRVNGAIAESAGLSDFSVRGGKRFLTALPIVFEYAFNNTGGDRVVPKGQVYVQNTFRAQTVSLNANEREGSVLPSSMRRFNVTWGDENQKSALGFIDTVRAEWNDFHFGWYTATLNVSWGETLQTANVSYHFFVFPWHLLLVVLLAVIVARFLLNKYKQSIIREAQGAAVKK